MLLFKPQTLQDAKTILEKTAAEANDKGLIQSAKELSDRTKELSDMLDKMFEVGTKVWNFFSDIFYCIMHPLEFMGALEPWLVIALIAMIILKTLGFKTDKWFKFILLVLALIIIFC